MVKKISDSERFLIGWGKGANGKICFFVSHKNIKKSPAPRYGEDLVEYLEECIKKIEKKKEVD